MTMCNFCHFSALFFCYLHNMTIMYDYNQFQPNEFCIKLEIHKNSARRSIRYQTADLKKRAKKNAADNIKHFRLQSLRLVQPMRHILSVREKESYRLMKPIVEIYPLAEILRRLPPQVFFTGLLLRLIFLCDVLLPSSYSTCLYQTHTTCSVEVYPI